MSMTHLNGNAQALWHAGQPAAQIRSGNAGEVVLLGLLRAALTGRK